MRNLKTNKRKFFNKTTKIATGFVIAGCLICVAGGVKGFCDNGERLSMLGGLTQTQCHITSVQEFADNRKTDTAIVNENMYRLVGTYDNNGSKSVIVLNENYRNKSDANKQINTDRDIYIDNQYLGVSGAFDTVVPDVNNSYIPYIVSGLCVLLIGVSVCLFDKLKHRQKSSNKNH